ncbi:hypothetical protein J6590_097424, partial [Homalodisca vitripennis]
MKNCLSGRFSSTLPTLIVPAHWIEEICDRHSGAEVLRFSSTLPTLIIPAHWIEENAR